MEVCIFIVHSKQHLQTKVTLNMVPTKTTRGTRKNDGDPYIEHSPVTPITNRIPCSIMPFPFARTRAFASVVRSISAAHPRRSSSPSRRRERVGTLYGKYYSKRTAVAVLNRDRERHAVGVAGPSRRVPRVFATYHVYPVGSHET